MGKSRILTKTKVPSFSRPQLPKWESSFKSHIALFTVEVTGATLSYFSRKRVYIDNLDRLLFVQTDKPIYKPGQNGPLDLHRVLPKFEVVVKSPKVVTILDKELEVTACGKYTYGKPVPGLVSIRVCRKFSIFRSTCYGEESKAICEEFSGEADIHGCFSQVVDLKIFQLKRNGLQMEISMEGAVTEEGTEVVLTGSGTTQITSSISDVSFEKVDAYYKPGLPLSGELKLVDGRKKPIANETIELQISGAIYEKLTNCYDSYWISLNTRLATSQHHVSILQVKATSKLKRFLAH
ncbi:hypothetical protein E2320_014418 [Naja naja]|nr:hypothetical protein E2320_014418 [Naja naja]